MTTELKITGMVCDACVAHVERALQSVTGVQNADVELETRRATVQHEGADINQMLQAVSEEGYEAQLES